MNFQIELEREAVGARAAAAVAGWPIRQEIIC